MAGLKLFANEGVDATSTARIAQEAGVSEGLIFRHFGNKEGLLKSILAMGEQAATQMYAHLSTESDPKVVIKTVLETPLQDKMKDAYDFWRLIYALKWQQRSYGVDTTSEILVLLNTAFEKLCYSDPAQEAELILVILDGLATNVLLKNSIDRKAMVQLLRKKYQL